MNVFNSRLTADYGDRKMKSKSKTLAAHSTPDQDDFDKFKHFFFHGSIGLLSLDCNLRYLMVNERMAAINGKPVGQHSGKTIQEVNVHVGLAIEPLMRHATEEGEPLEDLEIEVPFSSLTDATQSRYLLVSCYPLKSEEGDVQSVNVSVQDITAQKNKEASQTGRLRFEALLSDLSAEFIKVPENEVDSKIVQGLERISGFMDFDRSTVWLLSPADGGLHFSHSYALSGIKPPPAFLLDIAPIWVGMVHQGELFYITDTNEMPANMWREKKYCRDRGGIKSILFIPLTVGGTVLGAISFVSYRYNRSWPNDFIQRLRLLGEIFANILERRRAAVSIQEAFAEIKQLKEHLEVENIYLRDQVSLEHRHEEIIGQSDSIQKVLLQLEHVSTTNSTVLILGETGTGKELIARAIHNSSARKGRTMIKVNCAALPAALIEAELFGSVKGAYTGAISTQIGRFESANGSTIFLDEIGELPLELQSKLLRVLQGGQFERLGSSSPINVDVRVVAATNRDLPLAIKEGRFREDLYYRLNVFPISVPPLRERRDDIPLLVWAMVKEFESVFGKTIERIQKKCMNSLEDYYWPGNIRELRNLIERAMILNNSPTLNINLPEVSSTTKAQILQSTQNMPMKEFEKMHILDVLERTGWRVRGSNCAAEILELNPSTLESKMRRLGIRRKKYKNSATST